MPNDYCTIPLEDYEQLCAIRDSVKAKDERIRQLERQVIADTKTITQLNEEIINNRKKADNDR